MLICPKCNAGYGDTLRFCSVDGTPLIPGFAETYLAVGQVLNESLRIKARWRGDRLGEVYKAEETFMPGSFVALRLFRPGLISPDIRREFETLAAGVRGAPPDPDVATGFFSLTLADGRYVLASGYESGDKLDEIITREAPLPATKVVPLLLRLAEILSNLHGRGWVHGNVSPENILVTDYSPEQGFSLKLLDYGIARTIARFAGRQLCGPTGHLAIRNYETYFAPELVGTSPETVDSRADVYGVGALCYHLLSAHLPFGLEQMGGTGSVYITDDPRPLPTLRPELGVPPALEKLMLRSLSRDRNLRPSMAEIIDILNDLLLEAAFDAPIQAVASRTGVTATLGPAPVPGEAHTLIDQVDRLAIPAPEAIEDKPEPTPSRDISDAGFKTLVASSPVPPPAAPRRRISQPIEAQTKRISVGEFQELQKTPAVDPYATNVSAPVVLQSELATVTDNRAVPEPSTPPQPPPISRERQPSPINRDLPPPPVVAEPSPEQPARISGRIMEIPPPPPFHPPQAISGKLAPPKPRWGLLAAVLLLAASVAVAGILMYFNRRPPVGAVVVTANPDGGMVYLDGKPFQAAPTTLQNVPAGSHKVKVTKDGYIELEKDVVVESGQPVELTFILQPVKIEPPPVSGTPTERVAEFLRLSEEAFARGDYVTPENSNALFFADAVLSIRSDDDSARKIRKRVLDALVKQAETAVAKNDLATAQIVYAQVAEKFPEDARGAEGVKKVAAQLELRKGQLTELLAAGETAFSAGKLLDPPNSSAYFYAAQVLAIDRRNVQAVALRTKVKDALRQQAEGEVADKDYASALAQYQKLIRAFPEDRKLVARLNEVQQLGKPKPEDAPPPLNANDPRQLRERGLQKSRSGDYAGAIADLEQAIRGGQTDAETYFALGYANLKRGQTGEARQMFGLAVQSNSNHGPSLAHLAVLAEQNKDYEKALALYERALKAGGGGDYSVAVLQQRADTVRASLQRAKEPSPYATPVTREEGGIFGGEIPGNLSVSVTGVRFAAQNGKDNFTAPLNQVSEVRSEGDKLFLKAAGKKYKFRCSSATNFIQTYNACVRFLETQKQP